MSPFWLLDGFYYLWDSETVGEVAVEGHYHN